MFPALLNTPPHVFLVRIGSWSARAVIEADSDAALLDEIFKGAVSALPDIELPVNAALHWFQASVAVEPPSVPPDGLVVTHTDPDTWRIESEVLTMHLGFSETAPQILLYSHRHMLERLAWRVHVSVVFHKMLLLFGRIYLHAGAVRGHDGASAFVAEKWSGKSTICMWLGRAGATILSDDHIVVRQTDSCFQVSGCEAVARVTAATEAMLFSTPLSIAARDFAGVLKKEFRVGDVFDALPYADVPLRRIFFPRVGTQWHIKPLARQATLARLLAATRASHRFADAKDYARHLDYFSTLVRGVEAFDLELTPDLMELNRLVEFLDV